MAVIGITINDVIRDFLGQFQNKYDEIIGESNVDLKDVKSFNLIEYFKFEDTKRLNNFLYVEAPFEIFGSADQVSDGLSIHLNNFLSEIKDYGEHEIEIVSLELDRTIPATLFFLSKIGCKPNKIRFVDKYEDKWQGLDVLITANPNTLESKPNGKVSVKVKTSYNENINSDFTINSLLDFIKDEELRNKILNTKIITYEEIK